MEDKDYTFERVYAAPGEITDRKPKTGAAPYPMNYQTGRDGSGGSDIPLPECVYMGPPMPEDLEPEPRDVYAGPPVPDIPEVKTVYAAPPVFDRRSDRPEPMAVYAGPPMPAYMGPPVNKPKEKKKGFFGKLFGKDKS